MMDKTIFLSVRYLLIGMFPFALSYLLSYFLRTINAVLAPDLVAEFNLSPAELGLLTAAYMAAYALAQLPLGVMLDRYGPRTIQIFLTVIAAIGTIGFALSDDLSSLFLSRALIGFGVSTGLMAGYKASALMVPPQRQAIVNALILAMGALGLLLATTPAQGVLTLLGWRWLFVIITGFLLLNSLLIYSFAAHSPANITRSFMEQAYEVGQILRLPLFWRIAPTLSLSSGVLIAVQSLWAGPYLRDILGLNRGLIVDYLLAMAVAFMIGALLMGIIADRLLRNGLNAMQVFLGFNIFCLIGQIPIILQTKTLIFPGFLLWAATGQAMILVFPWFASHIGAELAGRSNSTINFMLFIATFAAQYGIGIIIGFFSPSDTGYAPHAYFWAFGFFFLLQLLAFIWYFISNKKARTVSGWV